MPDRGQHISVITQENLKLAYFLFHHQWRCTLDWEVMGVHKKKVHLLAGQKKLKDKYKDLKVKSDMAGMMESIKENLRSCHGVMKAHLAYIVRKTIIVQTYGDYPLHLPPSKNKLND